MVDIHCHLLPGLDDGPGTLEEALEMAEAAIRDGITHVVATPHASDTFSFVPGLVEERRAELAQLLGDRLILATGCDFHMTFENVQDALRHPAKYAINQKNYLLVEFADLLIPPTMDDALHQLQLVGLNPIITHPERNSVLCRQPVRLARWVYRGCYAQVTAGSLLGQFGGPAQRAAEEWIERDLVHFVASDAHNVRARPLRLRQAHDAVKQRWGEPLAHALFYENPLAAFEGRPLPWVREIPNPDEAKTVPRPRRRKRFLFF